MSPKVSYPSFALTIAICLALLFWGGSTGAIVSCPQGVEIFDPKYDVQPRLPMFAECKSLKHMHPSDIRCQISKQLIIQAEYGSVVQWIRSDCTTAAICQELRSDPGYSHEDGAVISNQRVLGCCQHSDLACIRRLVDM